MIHVVENGKTFCNWPWDYLAGKRKDKKVPPEKFAEVTCSACKKEGAKKGLKK